jgi:hypothetical protein
MPRERLGDSTSRAPRLSYKFQRLRERLREAIETGVLSGKLPGERVLARQFRVNAKTLSKALTDLAAEGILERTIGRGTFVRGWGNEEEPAKSVRWLILTDPSKSDDPVLKALQADGIELEISSETKNLRPSFLTGFDAVIDAHGVLSESALRDLLLRSPKVVLIDTPPRLYSAHAVLIDRVVCAGRLVQQFIRDGHTHLAVACELSDHEIVASVRQVAHRLDASIRVDHTLPENAPAAARAGVSAFIACGFNCAQDTRRALESAGSSIPDDVSLAGLGVPVPGTKPVTGYIVTPEQVADAVRLLLSDAAPHRPQPVWLVGTYFDAGTTRHAPASVSSRH